MVDEPSLSNMSKEQLLALVKELKAKKSKTLKWESEMPKIIALVKKEFPNLSDKERANLLAHSGWHYERMITALR